MLFKKFNGTKKGNTAILDIKENGQLIDLEKVNNQLGEKLDIKNAFNFIEKPSTNYAHLLDKIKVITNLILNENVFNFLIEDALQFERKSKKIRIGSKKVNDFWYTSVSTKYDDVINNVVLAQRKNENRFGLVSKGTITSFILRKDLVLKNFWLNKIEIRMVGLNGKTKTLNFKYTTTH